MLALFVFLGIGLGGVLAWKIVASVDQSKYSSRLQDLESKIRYRHQENIKLTEKVTAQTAIIGTLESSLDKERAEHAGKYLQLGDAFKNALMITGFSTFILTAVIASSVTGYTVSIWAEVKNAAKSSDTELNNYIVKHENNMLNEQIVEITKERNSLREKLQESLIEKEVALTKLRILLKSLSFEGGVKGFVLDYPRLKRNLSEDQSSQGISEQLALAQPMPRAL